MVADSEITISTTKHMAGTDAAPFLSYLGRSKDDDDDDDDARLVAQIGLFQPGYSEVAVQL